MERKSPQKWSPGQLSVTGKKSPNYQKMGKVPVFHAAAAGIGAYQEMVSIMKRISTKKVRWVNWVVGTQ